MTGTAIAVIAGAASSALAGPGGGPPAGDPGGVDGVPVFIETFDRYTAGQGLQPQGAVNGWEPFWGTGADGLIVDTPAGASRPNSFRYDGAALTDQANKINFTNPAQYVIRVQTYVPSATAGEGFFIVHNEFEPFCAEWALQVEFDSVEGTVRNDAGGFAAAPTLPLQRDRWVPYTAIVNLNGDVYWDYYGSELLTNEYQGMPLGWAGNNALAGGCTPGNSRAIANLNLFGGSAGGQLMDDVMVACYADMTAVTTGAGAGVLDVFDFLAYQDAFVANSILADCNGDQSLDIFDFLCFQDLFIGACGS